MTVTQLKVKCIAQGHYTAEAGTEPRTFHSRFLYSTTIPLCSAPKSHNSNLDVQKWMLPIICQGFSWADFGAHYGPHSQLKKCVKFPNFQVKNPKRINKSLYICCGYIDHTLKLFFSEKYPQINTKYAYYPLFCFVSIFPI